MHRSRLEIEFIKMIEKILKGICDFVPQYQCCNGKYKIDIFEYKYGIAIEYDEKHHVSKKLEDENRQREIESELGCVFIRVKEGREVEGINEILQLIHKKGA